MSTQKSTNELSTHSSSAQQEEGAAGGLAGFEPAGFRAFYRPSGRVTDGQLADMIDDALRAARAAGLRDAVVNVSQMTGFESPGPAYRRWVARRWAETVEGALRVAIVARPEYICPEKTGLLVAAEEGLDAFICETEADAIVWLDANEASANRLQ